MSHHCAPQRYRFRRRLAKVLLGVSLLVLTIDTLLCYGQEGQGADVVLQALARLLIVVIAYVAVRSAHDDRIWPLIWGLIGISFDTFWSLPGGYEPSARVVLMVIKYLAVPAGLAALIRFTAEFGGPDCDIRGVRRFIRNLAWPLGGVLAVVGLFHGITYFTDCKYAVNDFYGCGHVAVYGFRAYLIADAVVRFVLVVAALVGFAVSTWTKRQFWVLLVACTIFALGPLVDFAIARLDNVAWLTEDEGKWINALSSVAFPLGLLISVHRRELYDAKYFLHKTALVTIVMTVLSGIWYTLDQLVEKVVHYGYVEFAMKASDDRFPTGVMDVGLGLLVAFLYKPASEVVGGYLDRKIHPDMGKRLPVLQRCVDELQRVTERSALDDLLMKTSLECGVRPLAVFRANDDGSFVCVVPNDRTQTTPIPGDHCVARLAEGKVTKSGVGRLFPGAALAAPIVLRGKLIGALACGPPMRYEPPEFPPVEERELFSLAREAGAALHAMGALKV